MTSKLVASHRERAEIYHGASLGKQKTQVLLHQFHLPKGLMPLNHLNEFGYNKTTTREDLQKLTGIKSKEMMIWITLFDIFVDDTKDRSKIYCSNSMGLSKSYPVTTVER
ncbi:hypothetical protein Goshw_014718 [Gossypium schwendimanii]|uniref:Uncharacterized protein n=1 Tax=Gossypium schwendimanii TaxID=34291 RepID=A0A7J9MQ39_GOSSC|nr:hypothetical protein [Gossypium schwendimanii]